MKPKTIYGRLHCEANSFMYFHVSDKNKEYNSTKRFGFILPNILPHSNIVKIKLATFQPLSLQTPVNFPVQKSYLLSALFDPAKNFEESPELLFLDLSASCSFANFCRL